MATCQAMVGVLRLKSSSKVQMKLIRNTLRLNRQNPKNPVVRDTNSLQLFNFMIQLLTTNDINLPNADQVPELEHMAAADY